MAKNQNTFAKRKREIDKKLKAEEKRARRKKRKEADGAASDAPATDPEMHSEANKATTHEEQTDPFRKDVNNE